jgi:hypothetical protein
MKAQKQLRRTAEHQDSMQKDNGIFNHPWRKAEINSLGSGT